MCVCHFLLSAPVDADEVGGPPGEAEHGEEDELALHNGLAAA